MEFISYHVDAFTSELFSGNPACVIKLKEWLPDAILLKIAQENAVAETAFYIQRDQEFDLRWFTPEIEMDLCGHATLATAHVIFNHEEWPGKEINFHTISGLLQVKKDEKLLTLDFPARAPQAAVLPVELELGLDILPVAVYKARDFLLLYNNEDEIKKIKPNRYYFDQVNLDPGGVIITAPGDEVDFVSRFFTPQASIFEDPVTGSAHCTLIPFWANRLGKNKMDAIQLSNRIGYLYCVNAGDRVQIKGNAITYSKSVLFITDNFFLNSK